MAAERTAPRTAPLGSGHVEWPGDGVVRIVAAGEQDLRSVAQFARATDLVLGACTHLVVDLTRVDYLDSALLNALNRARGAAAGAGKRFHVVIGDNELVRRALEFTELLEPLNTVETFAEAVAG